MRKSIRKIKFKFLSYKVSVFLLLIICANNTTAQNLKDDDVDRDEIELLVNTISDSLEYYYVDVEVGKQIGNHLKSKFKNGLYKKIIDPKQLAKQITTDLRSVNGDLHLYLEYINQSEEKLEIDVPSKLEKYGLSTNYGFQEIKFIEGDIAYLKISHFSNWDFASKARQKVTETMGLFKNSDAFIIDLRDNRGGVPYIASFLASYFFDDKPVHLADFYTRFDDYKYGIFTEPFVAGMKYPEVPLFILVNNKSASAAEEFAFWLQNQKRATIVGNTTAGAGYGAMTYKINNRFSVSISSEEEIDPVTKKGFQGTGVIPDTIVNDSSSFFVALELAKKSIQKDKPQDSTQLKIFYKFLDSKESSISEVEIFEQVILLNQLGLLNYDDIEKIGNQYITEPKKSLPILRANTVLYSFYPNPFETYAKALATAKNYELALFNYNKAVQLARIKKNPSLSKFQLNQENFIKKYGSLLEEK